jgi:hypothetical protein
MPAFGTTAPLESVTVPPMRPVDWAKRALIGKERQKRANKLKVTLTRRLLRDILDLLAHPLRESTLDWDPNKI